MRLIDSIYNEPEKWRLDSHCMRHEKGAQLWVVNGLWFCQPRNAKYGLINKVKAWRAYKWWCKNAPVEHLAYYD